MHRLEIFSPGTIPEICLGDDLCEIISAALRREGETLQDGDIVALAHKIVSKSEGSVVDLATVTPGEEAQWCAKYTGKDPALVEVILSESTQVLRYAKNGPLICRHRLGFVCANAGVDQSNTHPGTAILLPKNPDKSASELAKKLEKEWNKRLGVLICDTQGRPFRNGASGIAVGLGNVRAHKSYVGKKDRTGRTMETTLEARADEVAAAATLLMGQGKEGRPVVVVRGLAGALGAGSIRDVLRPAEKDLFLKSDG
ncbi:coenzyme F420-0:L-glutamate ligase [Clostridia bacterium OttesenSCG-928-O13]|nr:coenzyme F420-0:L-glutamate ligase [Clostridia bacterium OttesenSCG-928-O13]